MAFDPVQVGRKLIAVGEGQQRTGNKFENSATELREVAASLEENSRIDRALGAIETATRSIRELVTPIASALHSIAAALDSITVPTIDFDRKLFDLPVIGKVRLVTGIDLSNTHPFRAIGANVEAVADNLDNIRQGLREVADGARDLDAQLPNLKARIVAGADEMEQGGQDLVAAGTAMKEAGALLTN